MLCAVSGIEKKKKQKQRVLGRCSVPSAAMGLTKGGKEELDARHSVRRFERVVTRFAKMGQTPACGV